jgi:hypothetical protein
MPQDDFSRSAGDVRQINKVTVHDGPGVTWHV